MYAFQVLDSNSFPSTVYWFSKLTSHPLPKKVRFPYDGLDVENGLSCMICETEGGLWLGTSPAAVKSHFEERHPRRLEHRDTCTRATKVQSFAPSSNTKRKLFEVTQARTQEDPALNEIRKGVTAEEMLEAHMKSWTEVPYAKSHTHDLRTVSPFLYFTGFADYAKDADSGFLCNLLEQPERRDKLLCLVALVKREWAIEQDNLRRGPDCYRKSIMDQGTG
jgi:hypothetical protein